MFSTIHIFTILPFALCPLSSDLCPCMVVVSFHIFTQCVTVTSFPSGLLTVSRDCHFLQVFMHVADIVDDIQIWPSLNKTVTSTLDAEAQT